MAAARPTAHPPASFDLIDLGVPCRLLWCDDLSSVPERSLDAIRETVCRLLASL